jgi:HEAT repeat protein
VKKRFRISLALAAVCALVAGGFYALYPDQPSFQGKRLIDWIWVMAGKSEGPEKEESRAVVRRLGGDSIPLLLRWLHQDDRPSMTERFDGVRHTVFFWLVSHKVIPNQSIASRLDYNPSHRGMAMLALPELSPEAKRRAIPALIQMLGEKVPDTNDLSHAAGASYLVLSRMAPESIPPLIAALTNQDMQVWALAAGALGNIGTNAKAAIPPLKMRLHDKDPAVRLSAATILGMLGCDRREFVPILIELLPELKEPSLGDDLDLLITYKEDAKPAVPILISILNKTPVSTNTSDMYTRQQAGFLLRAIAPEAAAKAGGQ